MPLSEWTTDLTNVLLGNSLQRWLLAVLTGALTIFVLRSLRSDIAARLATRADPNGRRLLFATLIQRTTWLFFLAAALYLATRSLTLGPRAHRSIDLIVIVCVWFQVGFWFGAIVVHLIREALLKRGITHLAHAGGFTVISLLAQAVVWITALALGLANAGVNVIALIAGLGTGGAAVALALRGVLKNLFARASISLDRVFAVGDNLVTGAFNGKVEQISNRTTSLRSVNGEQIIISNADLLRSRLRNFGRIMERREVLTLRLPRSTPTPLIRRAVELTAAAIRDEAFARFERCHFATIADDALQIEAVYHVQANAPMTLPDVRYSIDTRIHDAFGSHGIVIGYPTQHIVLAAS